MKHLQCMELIQTDLERVEALLGSPAPGQNLCLTQIVDELVNSGGKRLRPTLTLLSGHLCQANSDQAISVAAGVELLHTATLVHDDLIDGASQRRGAPTLNSHLSPGVTILIGDFLFARSAALVARTGHPRMVLAFADTLSIICDGEVQQMLSRYDPCARLTRAAYDQRIAAKTASLLALCAKTGAILAGVDEEAVAALHTYGESLGMAFQIVDDVLDFIGDQNELGKPVGEDLRQGLVTLPTFYFLEAHPAHPDVMAVMEQRPSHRPGDVPFSAQDDSVVEAAVAAVRSSDALERSLQDARQLAQTAQVELSSFSPSPYRDAMWELAEFVVERSF